MTCREVVELMTDYLDGALPEDARLRFEEHIAGCDGCSAYLEQLRTARRLVGRMAQVPVPERVREELLAAFRHFRRQA